MTEHKEQYNQKLKNFLETQGTTNSTTAPHSSESNAFVERRMGIIFAAAKAALKAASDPLNNNQFWSYSALDAINKTNYLPMKREGTFNPSPHTEMLLHGNKLTKGRAPTTFCHLDNRAGSPLQFNTRKA